MSNIFHSKSQIDLIQQKQRYFEAGIKNADLTNTVFSQIYTASLTFCFAELALLGSTRLQESTVDLYALIAAVFLAVAVFLILISIHQNWSKVSVATIIYLRLAEIADEYIVENKKRYVSSMPSEFHGPLEMIEKMSKKNSGHTAYKWSIGFEVVATILTIITFTMRLQ
jgi:hypothetical protein